MRFKFLCLNFCALQVFVFGLTSSVRFFASFRDPKIRHFSRRLPEESNTQKNHASLHGNMKKFDRAQINEHDAMEFD